MKSLFLIILLALAGCSFKKNQLENQTANGHTELYSEPDEDKSPKLDEDEKRIIIAATNDVQGSYQTQKIAFTDDHHKGLQTIKVGGIDTIQSYFNILRDAYKNVVLVDSGDIFASGSSTNTVRDFYDLLHYDAMTVGLNDFNLKLPSHLHSSAELFKRFAKSSKTPLLLSNLYELKTARVVEWEGTKPYIIKDFGGVKVGIMGILPDDIVTKTPVNNRVGLFVENMIQSTLRNARLLRSMGADIIVVLTHQNIDCNSELAQERKLPLSKVNFDPKNNKSCNLEGNLGAYLERLPPHLVDVVIGGRSHQKTANFVNETLVLSGFPDGKSFSYVEFTVNTKTKKIERDETVVHQPVMFCQEFFKETKDCYTEDPTVDHKARIPAAFLGKPIASDGKEVPQEARTTGHLDPLEVARSLVTFTADISYAPGTSGHSQLFVMSVNGQELSRILEEDYNSGAKDGWIPSPFTLRKNGLALTIAGLPLDPDKTYRILTDLEAMQAHPKLLRNMTNAESEALMNHSWNSYREEKDMVTSQLAAPAR